MPCRNSYYYLPPGTHGRSARAIEHIAYAFVHADEARDPQAARNYFDATIDRLGKRWRQGGHSRPYQTSVETTLSPDIATAAKRTRKATAAPFINGERLIIVSSPPTGERRLLRTPTVP